MNTYLAERDMAVRLGENHREVERRQLRRLARGSKGFSSGILSAIIGRLSQSAKLANEPTEPTRPGYARPQTSQPECS
jgi:hypothetical protein